MTRWRWLAPSVAPLALVLLSTACAHAVPTIPARGTIGGQPIETTVDSPAARYYLERYLRGERRAPEWDAAFDALHAGGPPDRKQLGGLTRRFSTDLASLYVAQRLMDEPANRAAYALFMRELETLRPARAPAHAADPVVLLVPGWDYVRYGALTGADFALPRRALTQAGLTNRLIAIPPYGSVETNAALVAEAVRASGRPVILASASSAGPAVALALGELLAPSQSCHVQAWINIGGLLNGSPIVDHYARWWKQPVTRPLAWWRGWSWEAIDSMSLARSRERLARLRLPRHVFILNYIGIPFSGSVSPLARDNYEILRDEGPNDGLTFITDALAPGAPTIVALGRDHYLAEDPELALKTLALTRTVLAMLGQTPRPACGAPLP